MRSRVAAAASNAVQRINQSFGWNLSQWGELTPDQVRQMAMKTKASHLRRQLVEAASKHFQEFLSNQKEIERLTQEAIGLGLKTDAEIQGYINKAAIASAKHDAKIQQLEHQLNQELQMVRAESLSEKALATASFQQRLLLLRHTHQVQLQAGNTSFQQQLRQAQQLPAIAAAEARNRAAFTDYINARDYNPYPTVGGNSGSQGGGGLFSKIVSFLTGRK
jgi:hypothetical protein